MEVTNGKPSQNYGVLESSPMPLPLYLNFWKIWLRYHNKEKAY
jgi:hypothetical protein